MIRRYFGDGEEQRQLVRDLLRIMEYGVFGIFWADIALTHKNSISEKSFKIQKVRHSTMC